MPAAPRSPATSRLPIAHAVDAVGRARVRQAGAGDQLVGGGDVAQRADRRRRSAHGASASQSGDGPGPHRHHEVGMRLVGEIKHAVVRLGDWNGSCFRSVWHVSMAASMQLPHQCGPPRCPKPSLTISSKNYSSWCLRGWLMCKLAGLEFDEETVPMDDPSHAPSCCYCRPRSWCRASTHDGAKVWDTLAIGEYLARAAARRPGCCRLIRSARALPRDLRRDALGLLQSALGAAHEPQGAPSGLQGLGRRPGRHRPRHHASGASA